MFCRQAFQGFTAGTTPLLFDQQAFGRRADDPAVRDSPERHRGNILVAYRA